MTLPGLESADADRSAITMSDTRRRDLRGGDGGGASRRARRAQRGRSRGLRGERPDPRADRGHGVRRLGPATGALDPDFSALEKPLPSQAELEAEENLDGLSEEQLETFRRRAVPEPGGVLREAPVLTNEARLDVTSTVICTGYTSEQVKAAVEEGVGCVNSSNSTRTATSPRAP
ncbi:MAG: hypothetical protein LC790_19060 [Actinobacteria bacterium]|nr:hypothetical protein [Actinomycetota bacterium]